MGSGAAVAAPEAYMQYMIWSRTVRRHPDSEWHMLVIKSRRALKRAPAFAHDMLWHQPCAVAQRAMVIETRAGWTGAYNYIISNAYYINGIQGSQPDWCDLGN